MEFSVVDRIPVVDGYLLVLEYLLVVECLDIHNVQQLSNVSCYRCFVVIEASANSYCSKHHAVLVSLGQALGAVYLAKSLK